MNEICPYQEPMLERILGDEDIQSPSPADIEHIRKCSGCAEALKRVSKIDPLFQAFQGKFQTSVPRFQPSGTLAENLRTRSSPFQFGKWKLIWGSLAVTIIAIALLIPWHKRPTHPEKADDNTLTARSDSVTIVSGSLVLADGTKVSAGQQINLQDAIKCLDKSVVRFPLGVEISFKGCHFRLRENGINVDSGECEIKVPPKKGISFSAITPVAVLGVRGTAFSVKVQNDGATQVQVYEGAVEVVTLSSEQSTLKMGEGALIGKTGQITPGSALTIPQSSFPAQTQTDLVTTPEASGGIDPESALSK